MRTKNDMNVRTHIECPGTSRVIKQTLIAGLFIVPIQLFSDQNKLTCSLKYVGDPKDEMSMLFGMWRRVTMALASSPFLKKRTRAIFSAVLKTVEEVCHVDHVDFPR